MVGGVKGTFIALLAVLLCLSLVGADKKPLTKADLEKVKRLSLLGNQLTSVKGLENLTKLRQLYLRSNPDLTKAQIDELKKALPKCPYIISNPTK